MICDSIEIYILEDNNFIFPSLFELTFSIACVRKVQLFPFPVKSHAVLAIQEKELETLFPIKHIIANSEDVVNDEEDDEDDEDTRVTSSVTSMKTDHVWPFVSRPPYWREHPQVVTGFAVASVAVLAAATMVLLKSWHRR